MNQHLGLTYRGWLLTLTVPTFHICFLNDPVTDVAGKIFLLPLFGFLVLCDLYSRGLPSGPVSRHKRPEG